MYKSDQIRSQLLEAAVKNKGLLSERVQITLNDQGGVYTEVLKESEFLTISEAKKELSGLSPLEMAEKMVKERISQILEAQGYEISEDTDFRSSDFYDGHNIVVEFRKVPEIFNEDAFFEEMDQMFGRKPAPKPAPVKPNAAAAPLNQEPGQQQVRHLPTTAKKQKTQNPRKVDLICKSVFESKFVEYKLATDVGNWKPIKSIGENGKLKITWENMEEQRIKIETLLFPNDTNKITLKVFDGQKVEIEDFIEIYRIPTDAILAEKFFRKTFFNLLKKFIDTRVIQMDPFVENFVFWKTNNPFFSYSFSSPKKNKIVKDLIAFISTAKKPILDDFFEQNNLKHKQGYLQTLLDSAEAAGIFKFAREGNEIVILRGPNYKSFLEGKIRRVTS